jgi:hypothetical protein
VACPTVAAALNICSACSSATTYVLARSPVNLALPGGSQRVALNVVQAAAAGPDSYMT